MLKDAWHRSTGAGCWVLSAECSAAPAHHGGRWNERLGATAFAAAVLFEPGVPRAEHGASLSGAPPRVEPSPHSTSLFVLHNGSLSSDAKWSTPHQRRTRVFAPQVRTVTGSARGRK